MKRRRPNTDLVTVKCNFTEQSWTLTCKDTEWIGDIGNCSKGIQALISIFSKTDYYVYTVYCCNYDYDLINLLL